MPTTKITSTETTTSTLLKALIKDNHSDAQTITRRKESLQEQKNILNAEENTLKKRRENLAIQEAALQTRQAALIQEITALEDGEQEVEKLKTDYNQMLDTLLSDLEKDLKELMQYRDTQKAALLAEHEREMSQYANSSCNISRGYSTSNAATQTVEQPETPPTTPERNKNIRSSIPRFTR